MMCCGMKKLAGLMSEIRMRMRKWPTELGEEKVNGREVGLGLERPWWPWTNHNDEETEEATWQERRRKITLAEAERGPAGTRQCQRQARPSHGSRFCGLSGSNFSSMYAEDKEISFFLDMWRAFNPLKSKGPKYYYSENSREMQCGTATESLKRDRTS